MIQKNFELTPIGTVEADENRGLFRLQIDEPFRPALMGLDSCTHAIILWWADQHDNPKDRAESLVMDLPYAPGLRSGVFANRSQARPNPIAITTSYLINVDQETGIVDLAYIDAYDGTPILDIKPYLPMSDRVQSAEYPDWLEGFPGSMEEAAEFFSDPENQEIFS
jgi:tRNA-Thr(GGU) m(6)t(6)A37 methyltransferase TsaA